MADNGYGSSAYGYGLFGDGAPPSPEVIGLPIGYGTIRYGFDYYGLGVSAGNVLVALAPLPDSAGASRRPTYIVKVESNITSSFDEAEFSLVVDGVPVVIDGVPAEGWGIAMTTLGTAATITVSPVSDTVGYLPANSLVQVLATYGSDALTWSFTTGSEFVVSKTEILSNQILRIYFNREPKDTVSLRNPDNYGLNPVRGLGTPVRINGVEFTEGNTYVDVRLASTVRRSTFYDLEVYNVFDLQNEKVSL